MKAKSKKSQIMKKKRKVGGLSKPKTKEKRKGGGLSRPTCERGADCQSQKRKRSEGWRECSEGSQKTKPKTERSDKYQIFKHQTS